MKKDEKKHEGCPNRGHCSKDETKCCYLVKNGCYLDNEDSTMFL